MNDYSADHPRIGEQEQDLLLVEFYLPNSLADDSNLLSQLSNALKLLIMKIIDACVDYVGFPVNPPPKCDSRFPPTLLQFQAIHPLFLSFWPLNQNMDALVYQEPSGSLRILPWLRFT